MNALKEISFDLLINPKKYRFIVNGKVTHQTIPFTPFVLTDNIGTKLTHALTHTLQ